MFNLQKTFKRSLFPEAEAWLDGFKSPEKYVHPCVASSDLKDWWYEGSLYDEDAAIMQIQAHKEVLGHHHFSVDKNGSTPKAIQSQFRLASTEKLLTDIYLTFIYYSVFL